MNNIQSIALFSAIVPAPFGAVGIRSAAGVVLEMVYLPPRFDEKEPQDPLSERAARQVERYLAEPDFRFDLALAEVGTVFQRKVWGVISAIPCGDVLTYGEVAKLIQSAPRAVGQACGRNWFPLVIPCHRVIASGGLGGFAHHDDDTGFHLGVKRWLLKHEGVTMSKHKLTETQSTATIRSISRMKPTAAMPPAAGATPETYHHGALREALLEATGQILLEQGMEGFTLRACARRAGVSHGAPAHHFGDVKGLLTAFAARGYERLTGMMRSYRERAGPDSYAQMMAVGQAYIDFALAYRAQFQLMYRTDRIDENDPQFQAASISAFDQLDSVLAGFLNEHSCFDDAMLAKLVLAWSAVHGFASLLLEGRMHYFFKGKSREEFAHEMGRQMLALLHHALAAAEPEAQPK